MSSTQSKFYLQNKLHFFVVVFLGLCIWGFAGTGPASSVEPGEILKDPALEARARVISSQLRCLVCQNQSIDDSNAPLAHDLRVLVRERLTAGDTDDDVFAYVVARYGTYVLLKPPLNINTLLLWLAPFLILIGASFMLYRGYRGRMVAEADTGTEALSDAERSELDAILSSSSSPPRDDVDGSGTDGS